MTVAHALNDVASASFHINLGDVRTEAPGHNKIVTLADAETETFSDILCNVEAETLLPTQTDTVGEAR